MGRLTTLIAALALLVAACTGTPVATSSSAATATHPPAPTTTPAPATLAPSSTGRLIPATITFDGSTCQYAGPTVVPSGSVIEWTLVNTPAALKGSIGGAILVCHVFGGTSWEDILAYNAEHPSLYDPPPWLASSQQFEPGDAAAGVPMRTLAGPYAISVYCVNADGDNRLVFPAALIQVLKG